MTEKNLFVPFKQLELDKQNQRQRIDPETVKELAVSIESVGLLQPLLVRVGSKDRFAVIDGKRRFLAIEHLIKGKSPKIGPETLIPIFVREDLNLRDTEAAAASAVANVAREAMNPADEVRAFAVLRDHKKSPAEIAAHFGISQLRVQQRLALADLSPKVLDALAEGKIDPQLAAAFTAHPNQSVQESALKMVEKGQAWEKSPDAIRRLLREKLVSGTSQLAKFVGRKAYEKAGGKMRIDLFDNVVMFEDGGLLQRLATEKVKGFKDKLLADGWSWVAYASELDHNAQHQWPRLYPSGDPEFTKDEAKRLKQLESKGNSNDGLTEEESEEMDSITEMAQARRFTAAQKKKSGVCIDVDRMAITYGLQKPEQAKETRAAEKKRAKTANEPDTSQTLLDDLAGIVCGSLQVQLAGSVDLAESVLVAQLLNGVEEKTYVTEATHGPLALNGEPFEDEQPSNGGHIAFKTALEKLTQDAPKKFTERVAWAKKKPLAKRRELLAHLIAAFLKPTRGGQRMAGNWGDKTPLEMVALAKPNVSKHWTARAETLSRFSRDQLLAMAKELKVKANEKGKKSDLAAAVAKAAEVAKWVPKELRS